MMRINYYIKNTLLIIFFLSLFNIQACMSKAPQHVATGPTDKGAPWIEKGTELFNAGLYQDAINVLNKAIEMNPLDASIYLLRGTSYHHLRKYNQTINDFNKAIELNPQDAAGYYCRALAYDSLGNHNQALKDMKMAAKRGFKPAQDFLINEKNN
jgi:tetratricopeptide (TPR) repeat protein